MKIIPVPDTKVARLFLTRARAEVQVLKAIADAPRRSFPILSEMRVGRDHFAEVDTLAIYLAIEAAADPRRAAEPKLATLERARRFLESVDCWDQSDARRFVTYESRWGPGPLCALFHRVPFDPDLIQRTAAELLAAAADIEVMLNTQGRQACA